MKKSLKSLKTHLLLIGLTSIVIIFLLMGKFSNSSKISRTGMVWTAGLSSEERSFFNLDVDYQLAKSSSGIGWTGKTDGFFLSSEKIDLSQYLGSCVKINGQVKKGWENLETKSYQIKRKWTYNRLALDVEEIEKRDLNECIDDYDFSGTFAQGPNHSESKILVGVLGFNKRPAPDIVYDFEIELEKPFIDKENSSGVPQLTRKLEMLAETDEVFEEMLADIGKRVEVSGYLEWGYSESRVLRIKKIKAL